MVIKRVGFKFKGKKIELEAVFCDSVWKRVRGLMFRGENAPILFFDFKKQGRWAIHSFFCKDFLAIWLNNKGEVVEVRRVKPRNPHIIPKNLFTKLIEIPINHKNKELIHFLDG